MTRARAFAFKLLKYAIPLSLYPAHRLTFGLKYGSVKTIYLLIIRRVLPPTHPSVLISKQNYKVQY